MSSLKKYTGIGVGIIALCIGVFVWQANVPEVIEDPSVPLGSAYTLSARTESAFNTIREVEAAIGDFLATDNVETINQVTMAMIRKDRYGYASKGLEKMIWARFAGTLESEVNVNPYSEGYVSKLKAFETKAAALQTIDDAVSADAIDFIHMITVVDLYYSDTEPTAIEDAYYDALFSWIGDLETFTVDIGNALANGSQSQAAVITESVIAEKLATTQKSYFGLEDYLADLDGVVISKIMRDQNLLLSEALQIYYQSGQSAQREFFFVDALGGIERLEAITKAFMLKVPESDLANDPVYKNLYANAMNLKSVMVMRITKNADLLLAQREQLVEAFLKRFR